MTAIMLTRINGRRNMQRFPVAASAYWSMATMMAWT